MNKIYSVLVFSCLAIFLTITTKAKATELLITWQQDTTALSSITLDTNSYSLKQLTSASFPLAISQLSLPTAMESIDVAQVIKQLEQMNGIRSVEINQTVNALPINEQKAVENTRLIQQRSVKNIDSRLAVNSVVIKDELADLWQINEDCSNVLIAVVDTGINYQHSALADNIWQNEFELANDGIDNDGNGYIDDVIGVNLDISSFSKQKNGLDDNGHGSHVAGIIAAKQGFIADVTGVCQQAKIMPVKVLDKNGGGSIASIIEGVVYAVNMGANIINLSLEFLDESPAFNDIIAQSEELGVLYVVAAGNFGRDLNEEKVYPASLAQQYPHIIAVASADEQLNLLAQSNYGAQAIDLAMLGKDVNSTWLAQDYKVLSGSSMAAPLVTGLAAHYWQLHPNASASQVKAALLNQAKLPEAENPLKLRAGTIMDWQQLLVDPPLAAQLFTHEKIAQKSQLSVFSFQDGDQLWFTSFTDDAAEQVVTTVTDNLLSTDYTAKRHGFYQVERTDGSLSHPLYIDVSLPTSRISTIESESLGVKLTWPLQPLAETITIKRKTDLGWLVVAELANDVTEYVDTEALTSPAISYKLFTSYSYLDPHTQQSNIERSSDSSIVTLPLDLYNSGSVEHGEVTIRSNENFSFPLVHSFPSTAEIINSSEQLIDALSITTVALEHVLIVQGQALTEGKSVVNFTAVDDRVAKWSSNLPLSLNIIAQEFWPIEQNGNSFAIELITEQQDVYISAIEKLPENKFRVYITAPEENLLVQTVNITALSLANDSLLLVELADEHSGTDNMTLTPSEPSARIVLSPIVIKGADVAYVEFELNSNLNLNLSSNLNKVTSEPEETTTPSDNEGHIAQEKSGGSLSVMFILLLFFIAIIRKIRTYRHNEYFA